MSPFSNHSVGTVEMSGAEKTASIPLVLQFGLRS